MLEWLSKQSWFEDANEFLATPTPSAWWDILLWAALLCAVIGLVVIFSPPKKDEQEEWVILHCTNCYYRDRCEQGVMYDICPVTGSMVNTPPEETGKEEEVIENGKDPD